MVSKTIKIGEGNYRRLLNIVAELQKEREKRVSFDDALEIMEVAKKKGDRKLSDLAGRWEDMNDKEAKTLIKEIYKERKVISRRL